MEIPQEIIYSGVFKVFLDTPKELEEAVKEYNKEIKECQPKMKLIRQIDDGFLIVNPIAAIGIFVASLSSNTFLGPALMIALMIISAAVFVSLGLYKHYLFTVALANTPLLLFNWLPAAILIVFDVGFLVWYYKLLEPLKTKRGYPEFRVIDIIYEKVKDPRTKMKGK